MMDEKEVMMDEKAIERAQIECVFSLGGGELHVPHPEFQDEWDGIFAYWYDGYPEYVSSDDNDWYEQLDRTHVFRTAIVCELFGQAKTPEGWERVGSFTSSGERECSWRTAEDLEYERCPLCEEKIKNKKHPDEGFVYLGDGWYEVVYRQKIRR